MNVAVPKLTVEFDLPVVMRDGVTLRANVYRPDGAGPWPTLLGRTPYGKDVHSAIHWFDPVQATRRGFMVVVQDTRGRFASRGEFDPFKAERQDGYDSVEWAARLAGSNGRVGMLGSGYWGNAQWLAAIERPPSLAAIAPGFTCSDPLDGLFGRGGADELGLAGHWSLDGRTPTHADLVGWASVAGHHDQVEVPSLNIGSWYDIFLQGTLDNYEAMVARGKETRLIVGPWAQPTCDADDLWLAFLGNHLAPETAVELPAAPVRIFVMGRDEWRDEPAWPLERAVPERWFLAGGGRLTPEQDAAEDGASELAYDPADPAPTVGGLTVMSVGCPAGPFDQARVEARDDVLVFTSEPLEEELEVTGRVRVVLHAESSAPSTDWVARLCDVHPDGRSINLCDGILRVAEGADAVRRHEIDLWSTSNAFLPGHRLRVHVTSSSFPRWDPNLNTGDQRMSAHQVARQRIHHSANRSSYIELPVVR